MTDETKPAEQDPKPAPVDETKPVEQPQHAEVVVDVSAAKENAALRAMLKAHNVPVALDEAQLAGLAVDKDGKVTGEYKYVPPSPQKVATNAPAKPAAATNSLSRDDLAKMSHEDINKRWDEVKAVLAA